MIDARIDEDDNLLVSLVDGNGYGSERFPRFIVFLRMNFKITRLKPSQMLSKKCKYLSMRSSMEEKIHSSEILFFFLFMGTARWKLMMLQIFVTTGTACCSSPLSSLTSREEF